jgi:transcriptional regulator with XRE-family HTH domain
VTKPSTKKKPLQGKLRKRPKKIVVLQSVTLAPEMPDPKTGRPPEYREEYVVEARKLCQLGATDDDLADFFEVSRMTIKRWETGYPEFNKALKRGKEAADDRVERSLYARATGYTYDSEKIFNNEGDITRVNTLEHVPPDVTACIFWLKNRRPAEWRDKTDHDHNHQHQLNLQGANMSVADAQALFRQARNMPLADLERSLKLVGSNK